MVFLLTVTLVWMCALLLRGAVHCAAPGTRVMSALPSAVSIGAALIAAYLVGATRRGPLDFRAQLGLVLLSGELSVVACGMAFWPREQGVWWLVLRILYAGGCLLVALAAIDFLAAWLRDTTPFLLRLM